MKITIAFLGALAAGAAVAAYLYNAIQNEDYSVNGFSEWVQSRFSTGSAVMQGAIATMGGSGDPVTIATGLIAGYEGFSRKAYPDPKGQTVKYSIGYGHQIVDGDGYSADSTISNSDAMTLLASDIQSYINCVQGAVTVSLTPTQIGCLTSLCYNIGCGAFQNSTLVNDLNSGITDSAVITSDFAMWNESNHAIIDALVTRRASEAALFTSPANTQITDGSTASIDTASEDQMDSSDDSGDSPGMDA